MKESVAVPMRRGAGVLREAAHQAGIPRKTAHQGTIPGEAAHQGGKDPPSKGKPSTDPELGNRSRQATAPALIKPAQNAAPFMLPPTQARRAGAPGRCTDSATRRAARLSRRRRKGARNRIRRSAAIARSYAKRSRAVVSSASSMASAAAWSGALANRYALILGSVPLGRTISLPPPARRNSTTFAFGSSPTPWA